MKDYNKMHFYCRAKELIKKHNQDERKIIKNKKKINIEREKELKIKFLMHFKCAYPFVTRQFLPSPLFVL